MNARLIMHCLKKTQYQHGYCHVLVVHKCAIIMPSSKYDILYVIGHPYNLSPPQKKTTNPKLIMQFKEFTFCNHDNFVVENLE